MNYFSNHNDGRHYSERVHRCVQIKTAEILMQAYGNISEEQWIAISYGQWRDNYKEPKPDDITTADWEDRLLDHWT